MATTIAGQDYLNQLAASAGTTTTTNPTSNLDKNAFLTLFTTQLKNQDPLSPQDNSAFVAQLAQFSTLEATTNLGTSVTGISTALQSSQALQASSLVGRSVVVDAGSTVVDTTKGMTGSIVVPASNSDTSVKVYDSTATLVDTIDLGAQKAGTNSFTWDGKLPDGTVAPSGTYSFVATGTAAGVDSTLDTYLPATVNSVTTGIGGAAMTLNLAGGTSVSLSQVQSIGI